MQDLALQKDGTLPGVAEKPGAELKMIGRPESLSFLKHFFKEVTASFNAPFRSDWDNATCSLQWREWGKL